ncbi:DNA ligase [Photobacterium aquae]|uniref:DNA ligase n=1 Tax=Photobacterium aquae TaxID=1195763 RepID=A0A0J1H2G1_9GAMM|nr:zinc ribbon domain-containing protein [Photobacterium aquae]KLV05978.1 DNA ligase [Photobacterium aquae]
MSQSQNYCPDCQSELVWQPEGYFCDFCQQPFRKEAYCNECGVRLEKLQACGSASYFCHCCNELKSKSRVKIVFAPQAEAQ